MSEHDTGPDPEDPVERLLREAVAADRADHPAPAVAARVMARIRCRRRLRSALLGVAAALGATGVVLTEPALTALATAIAGGLPGGWHDHALPLMTLALCGAGWMVLIEEEAL